jgi:hypothetical protein
MLYGHNSMIWSVWLIKINKPLTDKTFLNLNMRKVNKYFGKLYLNYQNTKKKSFCNTKYTSSFNGWQYRLMYRYRFICLGICFSLENLQFRAGRTMIKSVILFYFIYSIILNKNGFMWRMQMDGGIK